MSEIAESVAGIIADVRTRGDQALLDYTERWDGVRLEAGSLRVGTEILGAAVEDARHDQPSVIPRRVGGKHVPGLLDLQELTDQVDEGEEEMIGCWQEMKIYWTRWLEIFGG